MGLYGHCRGVCTESWFWEKNPLLQQGNQTCVGRGPVRCSTNWATSPPHENGSRKYSKSSFLHRGEGGGGKDKCKDKTKDTMGFKLSFKSWHSCSVCHIFCMSVFILLLMNRWDFACAAVFLTQLNAYFASSQVKDQTDVRPITLRLRAWARRVWEEG